MLQKRCSSSQTHTHGQANKNHPETEATLLWTEGMPGIHKSTLGWCTVVITIRGADQTSNQARLLHIQNQGCFHFLADTVV